MLLFHLECALAWQAPSLQHTAFKLSWTDETAQHNLNILKVCEFNLGRTLPTNPAPKSLRAMSFGPQLCSTPCVAVTHFVALHGGHIPMRQPS
jgi:hypothetical protein